jgi:hypothetical protein
MCGDQQGKAQLLHLCSSPFYELLKLDRYQQVAHALGGSELLFPVSITCVYASKVSWRRVKQESIVVSDRQKKIVNRLLDGLEGKLTTEKWAKLTKSSHDTALRDIQDLVEKGILKQEKGEGRSTAYSLVI